MREGRRQRLGLQEGTEGTVEDTYLDRILEQEGPRTLALDPDAFVDTRDQRYVQDAYNYYLGGGLDDYTEGVDLETGQPDLTGGQMIDTGGGGGDQDLVTGGVDTTQPFQDLVDPDVNIDEFVNEDTTMPPNLTSDMGMDSFVDTTPDYSGAGTANPRRPGMDTIIRDEPVTLGPVDPGVTNPRVSPEVRDALAQTPPGGGDPDMFYDEPVNLIERDYTGRPVIAGRGDVTTTPDYTYDPMNPPMLGDTGGSMDYMSGSLDAPYGVNPDTGIPYQTPRTIADQNRVLGQTFEADEVDQQGNLLQKGVDKLREMGIDPFTTALSLGVNTLVDFPLSLVAKVVSGMLPDGIETTTNKAREIGLIQGDNTVTQDIYGINTQSAFGDYNQYNIDRVEQLENKVNKTPRDEAELKQRKDYIKSSGALGDIDDDPTGDAQIAEDAQDLNLMDVQDDMAGIETGDASLAERIAAEDRAAEQAAAAQAAAAQSAKIEAQRRALQNINADGDGGGNQGGGGESEYGGFCFDPSTPIQMADKSEKKIKEIQLGDNTKGGEVTGVFQFKATDEIHDYKGVTVAGSHYVKEDGKFIMVQDSPLSVKIDKIPVVYSLDTTGRRIFIKGIEFADYNGDGIAKGFLHNAGLELNGFNKEVLRQVENRLI